MVHDRRTALRLAAAATLMAGFLGIGAGAAVAQTDGLGGLLDIGGADDLGLGGTGGTGGTTETPPVDGDPGNALDGVTDLVQDIVPGGVGGEPLVDISPLDVEVPGLADVAADVDVLERDSVAEVPCLGIGLADEPASCPDRTPTPDEQQGDLVDIPLHLREVPVVGDVTGDVNVDHDLDTDVCLNAELLGDLTESLLDAVSSGIGSRDCLGSAGVTGTTTTTTTTTTNPPATGLGSTVPGTGNGNPDGTGGGNGGGAGGQLPFTGVEGVNGLGGLGAAMFAGGHLLRRLTGTR
jgi:hypothetical protein